MTSTILYLYPSYIRTSFSSGKSYTIQNLVWNILNLSYLFLKEQASYSRHFMLKRNLELLLFVCLNFRIRITGFGCLAETFCHRIIVSFSEWISSLSKLLISRCHCDFICGSKPITQFFLKLKWTDQEYQLYFHPDLCTLYSSCKAEKFPLNKWIRLPKLSLNLDHRDHLSQLAHLSH